MPALVEDIKAALTLAKLPNLALQREAFIQGFEIAAIINSHPRGETIQDIAYNAVADLTGLPELARHNLTFMAQEAWIQLQEQTSRIKTKGRGMQL